MNHNDYTAQAVVPAMAQAIFNANLHEDPRGCFTLACTLFSLLEGVIEGNDLDMFMLEFGDDFDKGKILVDGVSKDFGMELDPEGLLIKSDLLTVNGECGRFLSRVLAEKVPFRPTPAAEVFKRKFAYTLVGTPSDLMIEAIDALEAALFNNNSYMLGVVNEVFDSVDDNHALKKLAWLMEGMNSMSPEGGFRNHFKPDLVTRMHRASHRGTPMEGDLGGALYEAIGVSKVENPERALKLLLWNMKEELSSYSDEKFRVAVANANEDPVKFAIANYDEEGLKVFSFIRTSKLLVELEAHINDGAECPYFGYLMGMDMKCAGVAVGSILTSQFNLAEACGLALNDKGMDAYEIAAEAVRKLGFSGITRSGMKDGLIPVLYGQTAMGLMRRKGVKSDELWNAMHSEGISENNAKLVANTINKVLGNIHGLRGTMKEYAHDFKAGETKLSKPIQFMTGDGCTVAPKHKVRVNLDGEVVAFGVVNPDIQVKLNGFSKYFEEPSLVTDVENFPKYGKDGLVNLIHSTDATFARLVITKLKRRGIHHIISLHDCFKVDINHQEALLEVLKESMTELFGREGNFPTSDLPQGTDLVKNWFEGANKSLIEEGDTVGTTQYFAYPGLDKRGKLKGKDGGINRFIWNLRKSGTEFSDLIEALSHPADRVEGVNSYYAN